MKKLILYVWSHMKKTKKQFMVSILFVLLLTITQAIASLSMKQIIEVVQIKRTYNVLIVSIVMYILVLLLNTFIELGWTKALDKLGGKMLENIRMDIYNVLLKASYNDIMKIGKDRLKHILYMDTLDIFRSISYMSLQIISKTFIIIVFLAISFFVNRKLTLVLLLASVIGIVISIATRNPIQNASMKVNSMMKNDSKTVGEFVDGIELSKTNTLDKYYQDKQKSSLRQFIEASLGADNVIVMLKGLNSNFHTVVSLGIAAFLSMSAGENVGNLVFYLFISDLIIQTSQEIETTIYSLMQVMPAYDNVFGLLDLPVSEGKEKVEHIKSIRLENVSYAYSGQTQPVTFKDEYFKAGDVVRIDGNNGSGKSTLSKILSGQLIPQHGRVLVNENMDLSSIDSDNRRERILYINQDELILNERIDDYLELICGKELSEAELEKLYEKTKFDKSIKQISNNGGSLSGGQRKKLLMMKLIERYRNADVIIIDEIEAGLDSETRGILNDIEKEIVEKGSDKIIFRITHLESSGFNRVVNLESE